MYDVIIVGARVAGASTAMLLARRGLKVLVVDRATFPSDTLSTHQVQLPGVARLADLDEDIAEAESWNDPERAARARAERDALLHELAAAAGPAGQPRLLGDQSERARKAVTARIRDIIGRIEQVHPALACHLRESITTGTRCCYSPPTPVTWRL